MRSIRLLIGCFGLVAVLAAAPIEFSSDSLSVGLNAAAAKPGNGNGHGNGRGRGHGAGAGQSNGAQGFADGQPGGGHSNGQANGRALGHADKDAVSGVGHAPPGHAKKAAYDGVKGNLGVKGSFNAIHSAAINKGVVSPQSRVARVKAYLDAAQELSDVENAEGDVDDADLEAAIEAAAVAAADASSQTVTADMLDQVNDYSNARELTDPGIDMSDESTNEVATQARDIQSGS
ncbi:MAG: hypothetical protein V3V34_08425 [Kiloniellales bacterium]